MKWFILKAEGFTLIELMIVILIIAILVAIAVPVYLNSRANAQRRTCQANLRTVDGAIQAYEAFYDHPVYPPDLDSMTMPGTRALKNMPQCPSGTAPYIWVVGDPPWISCPIVTNHSI